MTVSRAGTASTAELRRVFDCKSATNVYAIMKKAGIEPVFSVQSKVRKFKFWPRRDATAAMQAWAKTCRRVPAPEVQPAALQEDMVLRELREIKDLLRQLLNVWR